MMMKSLRYLWPLVLILLPVASAFAQKVPATDRRLSEIRHLDLVYTFPTYATREQWQKRAEHLRHQILFSAGLWPMPQKQPIRAHIFDRVDRGEYTIEKVYFESFPGHYVTGNLFRPKRIDGRVPAILNPHGHWSYGRLENSQNASIPVRAANFARLGMVAFTYDMVGYVDSQAISHRFAIGHREGMFDRETLWGVNLLGLQLWNSIRALDFLLTLPEVDPERIGATGASGGGTQTFLLAAVDERVKVAAPVNMISSTMQGGSLCENAPLLRVDTNNMELGALMAPRPLLMISATGDWTKNTLEVEYPAVRSIYRLFGAEENLHAVRIDAPHNYNQASREAVYGWFAHYLLKRAEKTPIGERERGVATLPEQLVFYSHARPANELDEARLASSLITERQQSLAAALPRDAATLALFRESYGAGLRYALLAEYPQASEIIAETAAETGAEGLPAKQRERILLSRSGRGDRVEAILWKPAKPAAAKGAVLVIAPPNDHELKEARSRELLAALLAAGREVLSVRVFDASKRPQSNFRFFTTYNRSDDANRVQDILTALAYLQQRAGDDPIKVVATGRAGLWALLARAIAPRVGRAAIDVDQFDNTKDEAFIEYVPIPGLRRAGDFTTAILTGPESPLLLHNTGGRFATEQAARSLRETRPGLELRSENVSLKVEELVGWLLRD